MFKKLRDKISEEVQQTSLRLPVTVQHLSQLSPFGSNGGETGLGDPSKNNQNLHDELLVDISDIQPAGDNKDLFSIDEDSREGSPSKSSEFQVVELTDENINEGLSSSYDDNHNPFSQGHSSLGIGGGSSHLNRRSSDGSQISDMSNLFPIYEVPGVSFNIQQSDLESCSSEWEDGNNALDKLSKDTVYQAYLRMRQRYHKYKGRYSDLLRVYKEKDKETEKLRDVLTKQQDKALRRISELREQCALEQQAKAHLEEELRSDLEEKDHKIEALQTKVRLLQEGCFGEISVKGISIPEGVGLLKPSTEEGGGSGAPSLHGGEFDTVSVGSLGSLAAPSSSVESEEVIDKLRDDIAKHKTLLARCMENIRKNKERIANLLQERDAANDQIKEKEKYIESLKREHEGILESLRTTVESSALSMAETKQQLFEELQTKEQEVERYRRNNSSLQKTIDRLKEDISQGRIDDEELEINLESQSHVSSDELSVKSFENLELKVTELENLIGDLQRSKMNLEMELKQLKEEKESRDSGYFVTVSDKDTNTLPSENSKEGIGSSGSSDQTLNSSQENMEDSAIDIESSHNLHSVHEKTRSEQGLKPQTSVDLTQQLEQSRTECERLKVANEALSSELRNLNEENESLNAEVCSLNDENETLHRVFKSMEKENEKLDLFKQQANEYNEKISTLQRELKETKENLVCNEKEKDETEILLKKLGYDFDSLKEEEINLKIEIKTLNESLREKCSFIETLEKKLVTAEKNVQNTEADYRKILEEANSLRLSISDYEKTIESLQSLDLEYKGRLDEAWSKLESEIKQSEKLRRELGNVEDTLNKHVQLASLNDKISTTDNIFCKLETLLSSRLDLDSKTKAFAKENFDLLKQVKDLEEKFFDFEAVSEKCSSLSAQYETLMERFEALLNKEAELNALKEELSNKLQESDKELVKLKNENNCLEKCKLDFETLGKEYKAYKSNSQSEIESLNEKLQSIELKRSQLHQDRKKDQDNFEFQIKDLECQKESLVFDLKNMEERYEALLKEEENLRVKQLKEEEEKTLLQQNMKQLYTEKEDLLLQIKSLVSDKEELSSRLKSLADDKQSVANQFSALSGQLDSLSAEKEKISDQLAFSSKKIEDLTSQLTSLSNEKEELCVKFNSLLQENNELSEKNNFVSSEKDDLNEKVNHLLSEKEDMTQKVNLLLSEKEVLSNSVVAEKTELSEQLHSLLAEKEDLRRKLDSSLNEKEELSNKVISLSTEKEELSNSFMVETKELSNQFNELLTEKDKVSHELSHLKMERENLCSQMGDLSSSKEEVVKQLNNLTEEKQEISDQLRKLVAERDELSDSLAQISKNKEELSKELESFASEKMEMSERLRALTVEQTKLIDQLSARTEEKDEISTRLSNLQREKEDLLKQLNSLVEDKKDLLSQQSSSSEELEKLSNSLNSLTVLKEEMAGQLQTSEGEKKDLLSQIISLNDEKANLQSDVAKNLSDVDRLQKEVVDLGSKCLTKEEEVKECQRRQDELESKNDELELSVESLENKLRETEKSLVENSRILDQEWQQKLSFELEKLQTEQNQRLADCMNSSTAEKEAMINQFSAAAAKEETFRQSIVKKEAEIIQLMDEKDSLDTLLEEKEEHHRQVVLQWERERKSKEQQLDTLREELIEAKRQLDKQVQELENSNSDLRQKIDELQNELNHLDTLAKEDNLNEARNKEEKRVLEEQLKEKALQLSKVLEEKVISEEKLKEQVAKLTKTVGEMKVKEEEIRPQLCQLTKENEEKEEVLKMKMINEARLEDQVDELTKTVEEMKTQSPQVAKENEELKSQIVQLSQKIESLTQKENNIFNQISRLEEEAEKYSSQISESNEKVKTYSQEITEAEVARDELKTKVDELSQKIEANETFISQLNKDIELKSSRILDFENRESELLTKISTLEENLQNSLLKERNEMNDDLIESKISALEEEITNERVKTSDLSNLNDTLKKELHTLKKTFENSTKELEDELCTSSKIKNLENEIETLKQQFAFSDNVTESLKVKLKSKEDRLDALNDILGDVLHIQMSEDSQADETTIRDMTKDLKNKHHLLEQRLLKETEFKERLEARIEELRSKLKDKEDEVSSLQEKEKLQKENIQEMIKRLISVPIKESSDTEAHSDGSFTASDEAIESCKSEIYAEYEERLSELRKRHEEERRIWKAEALEVALKKEQEMKAKMEALASQNYREKKELERLTRVAANAFKSGSESVDLLRDQVAKQRSEMEETKRKHQKEVEEIKALLEVKRRKGRGGHGELRNAGGSLEDAAEFEYLRNILYQYMIGKETQTLAKVLCAVVKFSKDQQRQIIEHEDRKQSLLLNRLESERDPLPENS